MSDSGRLRCNYCWESLKEERAIVTSCSHVFCLKDARKFFESDDTCPCCRKQLDRRTDIRDIRFDAALGMELWGLHPNQILEVAASAISLYNYQKQQEIAYEQHQNNIKENKNLKIKQEGSENIVKLTNEINMLKNRLSAAEDSLNIVQSAHNQLQNEHKEKVRQCRKYEQLYKSVMTNVSSPKQTLAIMNKPSPLKTSFSSAKISTPVYSRSSRPLITDQQQQHASENHPAFSPRNQNQQSWQHTNFARSPAPSPRVNHTPLLNRTPTLKRLNKSQNASFTPRRTDNYGQIHSNTTTTPKPGFQRSGYQTPKQSLDRSKTYSRTPGFFSSHPSRSSQQATQSQPRLSLFSKHRAAF